MKLLRLTFALLTVCTVLLIIGCNKDTTTTNPVNPIDTSGAELKVIQANTALETVLNNLINQHPGPERPSGIDLHLPYNLYRDALRLNPNNVTANFGAGILQLVMLSQDSATNHEFDIWKQFGDSGSFFEVPHSSVFGRAPSGIKPVLQYSDLAIPIFPSIGMLKGMTDYSHIQTTNPMFSRLQDYAVNTLIPKLDTMITRFTFVAQHPNFNFHVTGRMQGDPTEDDVILDLTEVNATLAGLNGMKAMLLQFSAYNFDFSAYDSTGMLNAMTPGSTFGRLRTNGSSYMSTSRSCWLLAINALDSSIYHLEHETGNTSQHLIKFDTHNGVTHADVDSMKVYIPKVRNALTSSEHIMVDADGDSTTPDVNLEISLNSFFTNPVNDMKTLFPSYTVRDTIVAQTEGNWENGSYNANVTFPEPMSYNYWRTAHFANGVQTDSTSDISIPSPTFDTFWYNKVAQYRGYMSGYFEMHANYYSGSAGTFNVNAYFWGNYEYVKHYRYEPLVTWTATNFTDWTLPNPTVNGLFPGITTSDQFKTTFGFKAQDWQRTQYMKLW